MAVEDLTRRLLDEIEIRNVINGLAIASDTGTLEEFGALYTEDAYFEVVPAPEGPAFAPARGRAEIVAAAKLRRADGVTGSGSHAYHRISNIVVKLDGDKATAKSYMAFFRNTNTANATLTVFKVYRDTLIRTRDGWKLHIRYADPA